MVADAFLGLHYAFLVFLLLGGFLGRRRWVLRAHVAAAVWGIGILTVGQPCPLTAGERWARRQAGQDPSSRGFIAEHVTGVLYPAGGVHVVQATAAAVVLLSWLVLWGRHAATALPRSSTTHSVTPVTTTLGGTRAQCVVPPDGTDPSSRA